MMHLGNQRKQQTFFNTNDMNCKSLLSVFLILLFAVSCKHSQYATVNYKPFLKKEGYSISIPKKFQRMCLIAENDYCYMFTYKSADTSLATIYIHYYPISFLVDEASFLVRKFYGDSVFCKYYDSDLDEEDILAHKPLYNEQMIDSVSHLLGHSDTLILEGKDDVYAWKEIRINNRIVVGYYNVPIRKCELFDRALFSLQLLDSTHDVDDYRKMILF